VVIDNTALTVIDSVALIVVFATDVAVTDTVVSAASPTGAWYVTAVLVGLSNTPPPERLQVTPWLLGSLATEAEMACDCPSLIVTVDVALGLRVMVSAEFDEHPDHVSALAKPASPKSTRSLNFPTAFLLTCRKSDGIDARRPHGGSQPRSRKIAEELTGPESMHPQAHP